MTIANFFPKRRFQMAGSRNCGLRHPREKIWPETRKYENSDWLRREWTDMHMYYLVNIYAQVSARIYGIRKMDIGKSVKRAC